MSWHQTEFDIRLVQWSTSLARREFTSWLQQHKQTNPCLSSQPPWFLHPFLASHIPPFLTTFSSFLISPPLHLQSLFQSSSFHLKTLSKPSYFFISPSLYSCLILCVFLSAMPHPASWHPELPWWRRSRWSPPCGWSRPAPGTSHQRSCVLSSSLPTGVTLVVIKLSLFHKQGSSSLSFILCKRDTGQEEEQQNKIIKIKNEKILGISKLEETETS